ncbi:sensor histidine kinase [Luteimicrobium subarcticum]|uniref:histidine kinase n=1 Tax=Luteimicrobium subarcticum TaxID=620910 RepID=A0A2M8WSG8_9MICO|nr:HAMP domain-containing sensor histidine kinase [Luteimicrobium subarcticum]PJI93892.1 two-component system OmpR family sensor kinase [Luteimicrobium subarcticum]
MRRPLTLRRQLVLVVVGILVAVLAALAAVSTVVLHAHLSDQLDDQLRASAQRAANFPSRGDRFGVGQPDLGAAGTGGTAGTDGSPAFTGVAARCGNDGETTPTAGTGETGTAGGGAGDGSGEQDPADQPPAGDRTPGQGAGQIDVVYRDGAVFAAYQFDADGCANELTDTQVSQLTAVPSDGQVHSVDLDGLGSYRAVSTTNRNDERSITAMPTASLDDTIRQYVLLEIGLVVVGAVLAWIGGSYLVRRSLAPLDRVATAAEDVSAMPLDRGEVGSLHGVDDRDTDERTEVGKVGAALNRMLDNVETSLAARHESETQVRQFVADASHELRTPLASIRGYSELVRRSPEALPPDASRAIDRIESEALRMGVLVEDLLLLARLDAGRPLDRSPVDVTAIAVDAVTDAHAAGPDHRFELELPGVELPDEPAAVTVEPGDLLPDGLLDADLTTDDAEDLTVVGDEARLRQVLTNLVGNARVHTPEGTRVVVGVRADGDDVLLTVRDDGPGIPAALVPSLFQRFSRGDSARNRTGGSTGLGLAIAHAIVQAHGGTITVETRTAESAGPGGGPGGGPRGAGTGTTFTVRLPAAHGS